ETMVKILEVNNLHVTFTTYGGTVKAVRGVNFHMKKGETLASVGESGCGKSVTSNAIMRLILDPPGKISNSSILFKRMDFKSQSEHEMRSIRDVDISMIFQNPMTALNTTLTIGTQLTEGLMQHQKISKEKAKKRALEMMDLVGIPSPEERLKQYPHQ